MSHPRVSAREAARMLEEDGYVYLDVRTPAEVRLGHPAGAYNVPLSPGGEAQLVAVVRAHFPLHQKLLVGCQTGARSQLAAAALIAAGFTDVIELRPGFGGTRDPFGRLTEPGWQAERLPTETQLRPAHDAETLTWGRS